MSDRCYYIRCRFDVGSGWTNTSPKRTARRLVAVVTVLSTIRQTRIHFHTLYYFNLTYYRHDVAPTLADCRLPKQSVGPSQQLAVGHVTIRRDNLIIERALDWPAAETAQCMRISCISLTNKTPTTFIVFVVFTPYVTILETGIPEYRPIFQYRNTGIETAQYRYLWYCCFPQKVAHKCD